MGFVGLIGLIGLVGLLGLLGLPGLVSWAWSLRCVGGACKADRAGRVYGLGFRV